MHTFANVSLYFHPCFTKASFFYKCILASTIVKYIYLHEHIAGLDFTMGIRVSLKPALSVKTKQNALLLYMTIAALFIS